MALQINVFLTPDDERELFRKLERLELDLWPALSEPGHEPIRVDAAAAATLTEPSYYLAAGDVEGYSLKRGKDKGRWKIDEVASPVIFFARSIPDEDGELRSGYFWAETETAGDNSRMGGKPQRFMKAVQELHEFVKTRFRKSTPVKGLVYFIGPDAARSGQPLREDGRKGQPIRVYR